MGGSLAWQLSLTELVTGAKYEYCKMKLGRAESGWMHLAGKKVQRIRFGGVQDN